MDSARAGTLIQNWRNTQKQEFGRRLKWARKNAGFKRGKNAWKELKKNWPLILRTYYSHEAGDRAPDDEGLIEFYAQQFSVSPDFLILKQQEPGYSEGVDDVPIHAVEKPAIKSPRIRYIPLLTTVGIKELLAGTENISTRERVLVPERLEAGPRAFSYQIPASDNSMVGSEGAWFFPGTHLIIDPDRGIAPGDYLLAYLTDVQAVMFRRLQSSFPYVVSAPRYPFKLAALNPFAEPILIESSAICKILGRMIYTAKVW